MEVAVTNNQREYCGMQPVEPPTILSKSKLPIYVLSLTIGEIAGT